MQQFIVIISDTLEEFDVFLYQKPNTGEYIRIDENNYIVNKVIYNTAIDDASYKQCVYTLICSKTGAGML